MSLYDLRCKKLVSKRSLSKKTNISIEKIENLEKGNYYLLKQEDLNVLAKFFRCNKKEILDKNNSRKVFRANVFALIITPIAVLISLTFLILLCYGFLTIPPFGHFINFAINSIFFALAAILIFILRECRIKYFLAFACLYFAIALGFAYFYALLTIFG